MVNRKYKFIRKEWLDLSKNKTRNNVTDDGQRRQKIKEHQNNKREKHNPPEYSDLDGNEIK